MKFLSYFSELKELPVYFCFTLDMNWGILNKDLVLNLTFCS